MPLGQPSHSFHLDLHGLGDAADASQAVVAQEARRYHPNVHSAVIPLLDQRYV